MTTNAKTKSVQPAMMAATYARFSNDLLQKQRSITDQQLMCKQLAEKEGYRVIRQFEDRGLNGAIFMTRPGVQEMIAAAKRGEFKVLIVEAMDRLTRDEVDGPALFKRLTFLGVKIHSVNMGIISQMHVTMSSYVDAQFRKNLGDKVKRAATGMVVLDGLIPGNVRYGYKRKIVMKDGLSVVAAGERLIDEDEAAVVRQIFSDYLGGLTTREIAMALTAGIGAVFGKVV